MRIVFGKKFEKQVTSLPAAQQEKLTSLLGVLAKNPFDSRLHTKYLSESLAGVLSFRITRDWRVTFQFLDAETIHVLEVAHRKDIYR